MKVIVDMNMSTKWVDALMAGGIEASHWSSHGDPSSPDNEIMQFAAANGYFVLTRDLDFSAILAATGAAGPSVVHLRRTDRFGFELADRVLSALRQFESELVRGAVLTIAPGRAKLRQLPFASGRIEE